MKGAEKIQRKNIRILQLKIALMLDKIILFVVQICILRQLPLIS